MFNVKSLTKKILVALRNFRFRNVATISKSSKVTWCGKIVNTYKDKTAVNIGANSIIEGELLVFPPNGRITIGDWCYLGNLSRIWAKENVTIGYQKKNKNIPKKTTPNKSNLLQKKINLF